MKSPLNDVLTSSITQAFSTLKLKQEVVVEFDNQPSHGDVSTNVAMKMAPKIGFAGGPRELANHLISILSKDPVLKKVVAKVEMAGPGFINFFLTDQYLIDQLTGLELGAHLLVSQQSAGQKIIIEFTDPNPFKEFHIGHLYSNTVGEGICRLYEATGAEVKRVCYQGDVGMHVAKSVWGMRQKLKSDQLTLTQLAELPLNQRVKFLGQAYSLGATAFEAEPAAQAEIKSINYLTFISAQENLQETTGWHPQIDYKKYLENTELDYAEIKDLYQLGRAWSLEYFHGMYTRLGMKFDDFYFESVVGEFGIKIVREYLTQGVFQESQGAVIFPGSQYGLHDRVFINSLGLPTYECKELGLAPEKYRRFAYDRSIIITGNEINEYFKVLLLALSKTNPELAAKTTHLSHGMVRLPEGKMSSRTGKILTGEWLLDEAAARVTTILQATRSELSASEVEDIAEKVGLSAVKYALLKGAIGKDIAFSFDESLSFQGNSGPYLQYSYVRAHSISQKAKNSAITYDYDPLLYILSEYEKALARHVLLFPMIVNKAAAEHAPHQVCTYLYQLAQSFNAFYTQHSVLGEDVKPAERSLRLLLTRATEQTLGRGLQLLGIEPVTKM